MIHKYKKTFVKNVIFRLDFAQPLSQSKQLVANFSERIDKIFIKRDDISRIRVQATMGIKEEDQGKIEQTRRETMSYRFSNTNEKIILMLEEDNLNISFTAYNNSSELKNVLKLVVSGINDIYGDILINRIGLRYINNINLSEGDAFDWTLYINDHLISMLEFPPKPRAVSRIIGRIELNKDTHRVQFYFGIANPEYPNPIARKQFILDYDCYSIDEIKLTGVLDAVEVLYTEIRELFERSIKDGLREKMGVIE